MAIPVTILCGGLGAGKTTLLSHLLENDSTDRDLAVLINDFGEVNVDADLVEARTDLAGEEVLALENGCICCSLGGDLSRSVIDLWKNYDFDAVVIEASGVGEPEPIARQFVKGPAAGMYDLQAVVTVVDARAFYDTFAANEPVRSGPDEDGTRPLADLLLEQVEFCDLLVVNKRDLVSADELEEVCAMLETLQPRAEILRTEHGVVDVETLLDTNRFDLQAAAKAAGWKQALEDVAVDDGDAEDDLEGHGGHEADHDHDHGHDHADHNHSHSEHEHDHADHEHDHAEHDHADHEHDHAEHDHADHNHDHDHSHPPEQYGITVETYHRIRPFHPGRFRTLLENLPAELIRTKGLTWIAGREQEALTTSYAGTETTIEVTGRWVASLPPQYQEPYRTEDSTLHWDEEWGDRETRLALIGRKLDTAALKARLDDCLLTDEEMAGDWDTFENSMPTEMGDTTTVSLETSVRIAE